MRPDRRDFLEPGDLARITPPPKPRVVTRFKPPPKTGVSHIWIGLDRWGYRIENDDIEVGWDVPGIVVGTAPVDLPFDIDDDMNSDPSQLRDAHLYRFMLFPNAIAWMHHLDLEVEKKAP